MKSSSNFIKQGATPLQLSDWQPVDFLTNPQVELSPEKEQAIQQAGKNSSQDEQKLAFWQSLLVKLPTNDVSGFRKVIKADEKGIVDCWQPIDFYAPEEEDTQEITEEIVKNQSPELDVESIQQINEMLAEAEQKLEDANESLNQSRIQSEEMVAQAQAQAEQLLSQAQAQVDQLRQQVIEETSLAARQEADVQIRQIKTILEETQNWQRRILEQSEAAIIQMVQKISKKLFGEGYVLDGAGVEQMVGRAINESSRLGNLRIYVNPEDHAQLISTWQESELVVNGQKIQLVPSQNIMRGGCFVEGEFGVVDSRIEVQLDILEKELNQTLTNREQEKKQQNDLNQQNNPLMEMKPLSTDNLEVLENVNLNMATDFPSIEELPEENNGPSFPAQPE